MTAPDLSTQIADDLRKRIRDGLYGPGEPLLTQDAGAKHYGVAKKTYAAAVDVLEAEGIVVKRSTKAPVVVDELPPVIFMDLRSVSEEVSELKQRAEDHAELQNRVDRLEAIIVNICKRLNIPNPFGGAHDTEEETPARRVASGR